MSETGAGLLPYSADPVSARQSAPAKAHPAHKASTLRVAYLINQYPKVSHSFIRREIQALERLGLAVDRISVRGWDGALADPNDVEDRARTRYLLKRGLLPLGVALVKTLVGRPARFWRALVAAIRMSRSSERPLPYHLVYLAQACILQEWLAASEVTHLHAHFGTNPAEVAMLTHLLGGPEYSFTVHGPDEFDRGVYLNLDEKIGHSKFTVAVNAFCRSQLFRRIAEADWPKIKIVHCGLDAAFLDDTPATPASGSRFVCVGRLCEQKGQLLLLDAFAKVLALHPHSELVLAGDGEMRAQIEAKINALGLRDHVRITGWISEAAVRNEILQSRALVLPSFAESLPVVIMEAMALRRPVITTYVAGIPELVQPGRTGWLVPASSVSSLADAMRECLETDEATLSVMGDAARTRVAERHSVNAEAAKLAALFGGEVNTTEVEEWR